MNTADQVAAVIERVKREQLPASDAAWQVAYACLGWAYVFGAYGEYCEPSNRRSRYSSAHPKIKEKCKNFNGRDDVPAGCVGCQWFLGTAESNPQIHEGRTRFFDCRGYVYWVLHNVLGMWDKCPAGCTTMWNTAGNWKAKGLVKDGVPDDVLVCLFYPDEENPNKMAHIGFGYHGETLECSSGVEYYKTRKSKWTHWAIPVCVDGPVPEFHPTIRRGSTGPAVVECQDDLILLGYDLGKTGADGKFGAKTEAAVKAFQATHKDSAGRPLTVDGVVGPATWAAIDLAVADVTPQPDPETTYYTVTIPHLAWDEAKALTDQYPGAAMVEEGSE